MRTLVKNGVIVDGTGNRPYRGDLLFEDDRILEVAEKIIQDADRVIDADGCLVCPGLIDAHSHNDFSMTARMRRNSTDRSSNRGSRRRSRATAASLRSG